MSIERDITESLPRARRIVQRETPVPVRPFPLYLQRSAPRIQQTMIQVAHSIRVLTDIRPDQLPIDDLLASGQPAVLKGLVKDWEFVQSGLRSELEAMQYLRSRYNGKP